MKEVVGPTRAPRAARHDALAAILPAEARARMALILTEDDFATLRHLAEKGTGANTLRAIASDLNYLETWSHAALGHALPWPATEALALKFIAHHLYDEDEHERDPTHGMPEGRARPAPTGRLPEEGWPARAGDRAPPPGAVVNDPSLEGARSAVRAAQRAPRDAAGRARQSTSAGPQERQGRHQGRA